MWVPNQLLKDEVVAALRQGGFSNLQIEFLGWLSYNATALNSSRNPVKAAHTILANEKTPKMLEIFAKKKKDSVKPQHAEHEEVSERFRQLERWAADVEGTEEPYFDS